MYVERTFGMLKGIWRILVQRIHMHLNNVHELVSTCIILHNICIFLSQLLKNIIGVESHRERAQRLDARKSSHGIIKKNWQWKIMPFKYLSSLMHRPMKTSSFRLSSGDFDMLSPLLCSVVLVTYVAVDFNPSAFLAFACTCETHWLYQIWIHRPIWTTGISLIDVIPTSSHGLVLFVVVVNRILFFRTRLAIIREVRTKRD